jgi:hypothetical protein
MRPSTRPRRSCERLNGAAEQQHLERGRGRDGEGARREQPEALRVDGAAAGSVRQLREQRRTDDVEQHVDAQHPRQRAAPDAVGVPNRRQRGADDRDVERRDEHAGEQIREDRPEVGGRH